MREELSNELIMEITLEGKQSAKAEKLVNELFKNILDKEKEPYLNHLYSVAHNFQDEMRYTVALLHDTVEDTKVTFNDLAMLGFREEYLKTLNLLTKKDGQTYEEYINNILESNNSVALDIKIADINNNMNPERLAKLTKEESERLKNKYQSVKDKLIEKRNSL